MKRNIVLFSIFLVLLFVVIKFFILEPNIEEGSDENPVIVEKEKKPENGESEEPVEQPVDGAVLEDVYSNGDNLEGEGSVFEFDKDEHYMNGKREQAEVKEDDYSYLLTADAKPFEPKLPPEWSDDTTQIDEIEGYFDIDVEERMDLFEFKEDYTQEEMKEWMKINDINIEMNEAYRNVDYSKYASYMYKGWREYHGVMKVKMIESMTIFEDMLVFYPERIDLDIGYAYGFYFRQVIAMTPEGTADGYEVWDGMIVYKQNDKGDWEVYYELPFNIMY